MSLPDPALTARYQAALAALLPEGPAWEGFRQQDGRGQALLGAKAESMAAVHQRGDDLAREANPLYALELLPSREAEAGLPDPCVAADVTIEERRLHLVARWRGRGGQHVAYYQGLAEDLGYDVTITERRPFRCGYSHCGADHQLGDPVMRHHWYVTVHGPRINYFRCGQGQVGRDPLGFVRRAEDLECRLNTVQPGHMAQHFVYEGI